jgi:NAD(P)-dependent dehydrogenase (short-subunit alcohol dehydrogenase family)/aryl carrier-like protein
VTLRTIGGSAQSAGPTRILRLEWEPLAGTAGAESFDHCVVVACGVDRPFAQQLTIESDLARSFEHAAERLLAIVRDLHRRRGRKLLRLVTRAGDVHAGLAGVLRTARLELPDLATQLIEAEGPFDLAAVPVDHGHVRVRNGEIAAATWKELSTDSQPAMPWKPNGVHLIAGGGGVLGARVAQDIAQRAEGAVIVIAGRSPSDGRITTPMPQQAVYHQVDIADRASVERLIADLLARYGRIDVIVHAAAIVADAPILVEESRLRYVLAPKVAGLVNLDEATRELDLHALICFASTSGAHGNAGQAGYAAANSFMDAYAAYRNGLVAAGGRRGRTLSIDWPLWEDGGSRLTAAAERRMRRAGVIPMPTQAGIDALHAAWGTGESQILVTCGDVRPAPAAAVAPNAGRVTDLVASVLEIESSILDPGEPLVGYGLDSIALTQFVSRLQAEINPSLTLSEIAQCETLQDVLECVARAGTGIAAAVRFPELIRMNGASDGRPVFWVHHGNGGVEVYEPLALRSARPFYGIQPKGWMTDSPILVGQTAMAAHYVSLIRAVQPEGPYDLGGFSFGGLLAYEVARQLQESGAVVATMVMVDTLDSRATKRTNALIAAGAKPRGPVSKGSLFRAANLLLGGGNLSATQIAARILRRDDVDAGLDEECFLDHLIQLAALKGFDRTPARLRARIVQLAHYFSAMEREDCAVHPLPDPHGLTCYYVRNRSGVFFGPHEPYMLLHPAAPGEIEALNRLQYWSEWQENLPRFHVIDVDTADHSELLTAPASLNKILELCEDLYAGGRAPPPALNRPRDQARMF